MGERTIHPWTSLCCSQCGTEERATRADSERIDPDVWLCSDCALTKPLEEEVARLTAEVDRLRMSDQLARVDKGPHEEGCAVRADFPSEFKGLGDDNA